MAQKLRTVKTMYQRKKKKKTVYFRRQDGEKTKWVSHLEKSDIISVSKFVHFQVLLK